MSRDNVSVTITAHDKASAQLIKMEKQSRQLDKAMDELRGSMIAGGASVDQFGRRLKQQGQQYTQATRSVRNMRGSLGQLGFQVQDVAVQLQHGTNPLVVFGQQGSQVASIFGPGGAMIGALIAVGAALGTAFLPKLFDSTDAVKTLEDALAALDDVMDTTGIGTYELSDSFVELARTSRELAEVQLIGRQVQALAAVQAAQRQLRDSTDDLIFTQQEAGIAVRGNDSILNRFADSMGITTEEAEQLRQAALDIKSGAEGSDTAMISLLRTIGSGSDKFNELVSPIADSTIALQDAEARADFLTAALASLDDAIAETEDTNGVDLGHFLDGDDFSEGALSPVLEVNRLFMQRYYDGLEEMRQQDLANRQTYADMQASVEASRVAMVKANDEEELQRLQEYADMQAEVEADRLAMLQERAEEEAEIQAKMSALGATATDAMLQSMQTNVNMMAQAFGDGSTIGRAFIALQQGMAVASALINAEKSASSILAAHAEMAALNPRAADAIMAKGQAMANLVRGMGYASAGAIAGQAIASFEGGGYTGAGIRAGGLDGKGGHLAMVHPNETIIDHEKGGSAGSVNINFAITANDTKGFDQLINSRRGMFYNMVREALSDQGRRI